MKQLRHPVEGRCSNYAAMRLYHKTVMKCVLKT